MGIQIILITKKIRLILFLKLQKFLKKKIGNANTTPTLFLTDGILNFYLPHFKSYSRYFYPLPLQRCLYNDKAKLSTIYLSTLNEFLDYNGEYIILQYNWFDINLINELRFHIENNYLIVGTITNSTNKHYSYRLYKKLKK